MTVDVISGNVEDGDRREAGLKTAFRLLPPGEKPPGKYDRIKKTAARGCTADGSLFPPVRAVSVKTAFSGKGGDYLISTVAPASVS